jgi:signal transduction histidine kinase
MTLERTADTSSDEGPLDDRMTENDDRIASIVRALAERVDPGRVLRNVVAAATERAISKHGALVGVLEGQLIPLVVHGATPPVLMEAARRAVEGDGPARVSDPPAALESVAVPVREGGRIVGALAVTGHPGSVDAGVLVPWADCAALALAARPMAEPAGEGTSLAVALATMAGENDRSGVLRTALAVAESCFGARSGFASVVADHAAEVACFQGIDRHRLAAAARHPDFPALVAPARTGVLPPTTPVVGHLSEGAEFAVALPLETAANLPAGAIVLLVTEEPGAERLAALEAYRRQVGAALRAALLAEALQAAEERVGAVVRAVPDPVLVVDQAGCFTALNPAAADLFALAEPFEIGRPARGRLGHPELEALLLGEVGEVELEVALGRPEPRRWRALPRPLGRPHGGRLLVLTEVVRPRYGQEAQLVAAVGRELHRPITAIGEALAAGGEAALPTVAREAQRLTALADQLVLLAGGNIETRPQPADVVALTGAVVAELRALHPTRGLIVTAHPARLEATLDGRLFERVLRPLLDNALRYSEGPVAVEVADRGETFEVGVVDAGPGIFSGDVPGLFERFHPLDGSAPRQGAGLGLHTCRLLVEAMGGRIWCDSRLGVGSRFAFRLPRQAAPAEMAERPALATAP